MTGRGALTTLLVAALASCTALVAGLSDAPAGPIGPEPALDVTAVISDEPAHAAVARFVPSLAGDAAFAGLVREAFEEARRTHLVERSLATRKQAAGLRRTLAGESLPDVFLGIPYVESRLHASATSRACAGGYWQFLPEVAIEYGLRVEACTIAGVEGTWSPGDKLADKAARPYLGPDGCRITACAVDDRRDFARSTSAALHYLEDAARWPELQGPYAVPFQVLAYNGGVGTVQHWLRDVGPSEPFADYAACADGRCDELPRETAMYLPRVVAAAAVVVCNAGDASTADLSDFARSDLCAALHASGLAPAPATPEAVLAARAGEGLSVGLVALDLHGYPLSDDRAAIEQGLADALASVPGIGVVQGVPGEDAAALQDQGADVVITGAIGRRSGRPWVRLQAGDRSVFAMIDPTTFDRRGAMDLAADLLTGPVREHTDRALVDLLEARSRELVPCVPAAELGDRAVVSVVVDADGRGAVLASDDPAADCIAERLAAMTLPAELAGAAATIDVGLAATAVADGGSDE